MALKNPYEKYQNNAIMAARPEELTLMLYNGAIKFINQAKLFMDEKNIQKSHNVLMRAQEIIAELNATLNMKYDISKNLRSMYEYILNRLMEANMKKDTTILDEVLEYVTELRDAWQEAIKIPKKK
ncbi:flagellar export chaperone FliS [Marinisporobacter balticus]|uniref:Flagellar protein FliS n=1 Tax=Marinisporobacter balticus TaxID=2018667 RepID=A0A4V2SBQ7_9FIRM|nr:flagellar export chaperone FliS [Marinisporobacter balticus]TCO76450.1 flagellar protein FliS [Marinisporobacter balticus]